MRGPSHGRHRGRGVPRACRPVQGLGQGRLATVSKTAESSKASRLWRASGTMSRSPVRASQDCAPASAARLSCCRAGAVSETFCMPSLSRYGRRWQPGHPGRKAEDI